MNNLQRRICLSAALALFGAAKAFCAPAPPTLTLPFDQTATSNKTPTLDWSDVVGSTYALQISTRNDFSTVLISSAGMYSSSYTVTAGQALTRGATYYWRVRASDATGDGVYSSSLTFHVSINRVLYTLDVDTMTSFNTSVLLTQQVLSPDFITPTTNQYMLTPGQGLSNGSTYYWRVKATDNAGNASGYAVPTSSFVVAGLPKPVLTSPANQKRLISAAPLLTWSSVAGATSYTAYISTMADFSLIYVTSANISGTQYPVMTADNLQNFTTYYWSVAATNNASTSVSVANSFYIETASTSTLTFPEDQRVISSKKPSFQWSVPVGTSAIRDLTFTLEWATNPNMVTGLASQTLISTDNYTLSVPQTLIRGATYYWRVKTVDNNGTVLVASTQTLHISLNRTLYTLDVDTTPAFNTAALLTQQVLSADFITPTTNQYMLTPGQGLNSGSTYYWRVKATDNGGNASGYAAPTSSFVVAGLPKPVLTSPANLKRLISTAPLLTWTSVAGATSYTAYISTMADFSLINVTSAGISGLQYPVTTLDNLQNFTTYYWSVAATNGVSTGVSVANVFYIETASTSTLTFPEDQRVISNKKPSFQWSVPAGTSAIRDLTFTLEWATNPNMVTGLASQTLISTDNYTLSVPQTLIRGATYYWRVKTVDNNGTALVASTQTLHISLNRTLYTLDVDTTPAFNTAALLTQQVLSADFITPTTNQYMLSPGQGLNNGSTYYWRVKATDNAGNASGYAAPTSSFVVAGLPKPVLTSPANLKRLISTAPLLTWTGVAGATSYTAYISTVADFSLIYAATAGISGLQYPVKTADNLQNFTTYYWSVAATNNASTSVSVANVFYIETASTSTLIFPEDQRVFSSKKPSFQWSVPGGTSAIRDLTFTMEWATNQSMASPSASLALSTDNFTMSTALFRGTTYYWRVKTADPGGTTLISSTQSFSVSSNTVVYTLHIDTTTGAGPINYNSTFTATSYVLSPTEALTNLGNYYWRVTATDAAGNAATSAPDSLFNVRQACPVIRTVCAQTCVYGTIQSAVNSLPATLTGNSCVYIQDGRVYGEQVTVQNFNSAGSSITITADPTTGLVPVVSPPAASTAAFVIANTSVNVQGIRIIPTAAMPFGVLISSAYVQLSSVSVQDAAGMITAAGVMTSSWTTVRYTGVTVGGLYTSGFVLPGSSMTNVSYSSAVVNNAAGYALWFNGGASSNTVALSSFTNTVGSGATFDANAGNNTISQSSMSSSGSGYFALYINGASSNTITQSFITDPVGWGAYLNTGSNYNTISQSTLTCNNVSGRALYLTGASSNTINQSYLSNPAGFGTFLNAGSNYNMISQSTLTSNGGGYALDIYGSIANTITQSVMTNTAGHAALLDTNANYNTISLSTMASSVPGCYGLYLNRASSNSIFGDYIQGSTAVYVSYATGTVIGGSSLFAYNPQGNALQMDSGSVNLTVSSSVLTGGASGAALYLGAGNSGQIVVSTNTLFGGTYGLFLANPTAGGGIWITSNTVVPGLSAAANTYGMYLSGLTSGATIQNNGIYYRNPGGAGPFTAYGLYAKSSPGMFIQNNRISNPGRITAGSYAAVTFDASVNASFLFNDVHSTGILFTNAYLLRVLNASTGVQVKDNIFFSSMAVTGSSATLSVDAVSQVGFVSNYNDFFSSNSANTGIWGPLSYQFVAGWNTATLNDFNSIASDPLFDNPGFEDFHPHSVQGRCALALPYAATAPPSCSTYVVDSNHSKTIDAGEPGLPYNFEPLPSGRRVNMGSYGNTAEASKSRRKLQVIVVH